MLLAALASLMCFDQLPVQGLRAFDETDASDFFGRAELIEEMVARLAHDDVRGRLVLVVGGSGTGKSSVVRAGLLPRVRRGDGPGSGQWFVATMLPGSAPFKELAESLRHVAVADTVGIVDLLASGDDGIDGLRRFVPDGRCCSSSISSRSCSPWRAA
jgi:hypothetical protein